MNSFNRKRKQQLSRDARKYVKNRIDSLNFNSVTEEQSCNLFVRNNAQIFETQSHCESNEEPQRSVSINESISSSKRTEPILSFSNATTENDVTVVTPSSKKKTTSTSFVGAVPHSNIDIRGELAAWVMTSKTAAWHVDSLLKIIKKVSPSLPKCCKTLCETPTTNNIVPMDNGHYLYIGLQNYLEAFLAKNTVNGNKIYFDIGSDGVGITESSTSALWPILAKIVGFDDVYMTSCFHGHSKPESANNFIQPFVEEFNRLKDNFVYNGKVYTLCIRAIICDAPARAFLLNIMLYSGYHSCSKCTIRGIYTAHKVAFPGDQFNLRTDFSFRLRLDKKHHHSLEETVLEWLPIDCVQNIPIDVMHCVYLGVVKQLLRLWIFKRRQRYSIPKKSIDQMSQLLLLIGPQLPTEFQRKLRSLKYWKYFKATEFRQLVLYILPVILKGVLKPIYYSHFLKLHCAMRILCDPVECVENNELASQLLKEFVGRMPQLYGLRNATFNVHSVLHLAGDVMFFKAPLDSFSAFKFENFMQYLKKLPKTGYRVLEQISNRIAERNIVLSKNDITTPTVQNKLSGPGLYEKVFVNNISLSTTAPNNYVKIDEEICQIQAIYKNESGEVTVKVKMVLNTTDYFINPINSSDVNVFACEKETFAKSVIKTVTEEVVKVAAIKLPNKTVYIALLH